MPNCQRVVRTASNADNAATSRSTTIDCSSPPSSWGTCWPLWAPRSRTCPHGRRGVPTKSRSGVPFTRIARSVAGHLSASRAVSNEATAQSRTCAGFKNGNGLRAYRWPPRPQRLPARHLPPFLNHARTCIGVWSSSIAGGTSPTGMSNGAKDSASWQRPPAPFTRGTRRNRRYQLDEGCARLSSSSRENPR